MQGAVFSKLQGSIDNVMLDIVLGLSIADLWLGDGRKVIQDVRVSQRWLDEVKCQGL